MMAFEGPFLAAIIARLPDAKFNLGAYGVAYAFAILVEAPVIMIMSASTALVDDAASFRRLRNFTYTLNISITALMLVVLVPGVFKVIGQDLVGLPPPVEHLTRGALLLLLPWPAAIGYRRFFQGLLIRGGRTRLVAYGTVTRLVAMTGTAISLFVMTDLPGAYVGAAALSAGVCSEALASRFMARSTVAGLPAAAPGSEPTLSYERIARFYYPLALTSMIGLAVQPMLTFFMGRARFPVESLAVFPVVYALSFIFRALGLSYQEVAIALMGKEHEHVEELGRFAAGLALAASAGLALLTFTPLAQVWFETISGLTAELTRFAITPSRILVLLPALSVLMSFQRAILVQGRHTRPITWATILEVVLIATLFPTLGSRWELTGVAAAVLSFIGGRLAGNLYLVPPCLRLIHDARRSATEQPMAGNAT
jgi:progressive ankylosis protein